MSWTICKTWTFDAAHQLAYHDGKCARPHGHTYRVEASFTGDDLDATGSKRGMLIDFGDITAVWKEHLEPLLDHQDLNETLAVLAGATTAENIAAWIYGRFDLLGLRPASVRVWETPTSWAEYAQ